MEPDEKPVKKVGLTSQMVAKNITYYRKRNGHTMRSLADALKMNGHQISHSVISQIENGSRRIDADELVLIATYIDTSATALLTPRADSPDTIIGDAVHPKASALEVVARNFRQPIELPEWTVDAIDTSTGARWKYMYQSLQTLDRLRESLGTDDIEMLLTIATGITKKEQQDYEQDLKSRGDD